jgi:type II secretory pathway pseudopilin PulG
MRFRIRTIMVAVVIVGLITALAVQGWQARRREAILRARLQAIEAENKFAMMELRRFQDKRQEMKILDGSIFGNDVRVDLFESNPWSRGKP